MKYKLLGSSGLRVSELCLGAMTFGEDWNWGANRETSQSIFDAFAIAQNVVDIAHEIECSAAQVALAWIRHQSPRHIPIIGARNLNHLKDNLGCLNVTLNEDQLSRLNTASEVDPGFALKFLRRLQNLFLGAATEILDLSLHPISRIVLNRK